MAPFSTLSPRAQRSARAISRMVLRGGGGTSQNLHPRRLQPSAMIRISLLLLITFAVQAAGACQSCLLDMAASGLFGNDARSKHHDGRTQTTPIRSSVLPLGLLTNQSPGGSGTSSLFDGVKYPSFYRMLDSPAIRFLAIRTVLSFAYQQRQSDLHVNPLSCSSVALPIPKNKGSARMKGRWAGGYFLEASAENDDSLEESADERNEVENSADPKQGGKEEIMSGSMIMAIGFYKSWISPLLPPACRFLPTCSQYGVQAIQEFGPTKGLILTAWRLARCSPLGGRGYDPPKWPPVPYTYGSY